MLLGWRGRCSADYAILSARNVFVLDDGISSPTSRQFSTGRWGNSGAMVLLELRLLVGNKNTPTTVTNQVSLFKSLSMVFNTTRYYRG